MKKTQKKSTSQGRQKAEEGKERKIVKTGYFLVPFMLMILSLVVESCLIFEEKTGFVGMWIHNIFTGLFGSAAYFIPAGVLVISFFYNSITENKTRAFKSVMLSVFILFLAAINSLFSIDNIGAVPVNIPDYFVKGYNGEGGGVFGGIVGKIMNEALGNDI